jgi:dihydrofolate synthase/folylpolyglutamate synthase
MDSPPLIMDGAQTPRRGEVCVEPGTSLYGEGGILLFGCAAGKDAHAMARILVPHFSRIIITTPGTFKVSYPEKVYAAFQEFTNDRVIDEDALFFIIDTQKAIKHALGLRRETGLPILGTGSFYLAAEIRNTASPPSGTSSESEGVKPLRAKT